MSLRLHVLFALNAGASVESKFTMKLKHLFILLAALLPCVSSVRAADESLASIFTNAAKNTPGQRVTPRRASIVMIACDGLRAGDLSCYGQTNFQTPNIDRLAAEGMRFTDYRAGGDDLTQAQATLMAGKNTASVAGESTLAARLQAAGYRTGLIGEWVLGAQPWTQGFDDFAGFINEQEAKDYYAENIWRHAPNSIYDETNGTLGTFSGRELLYGNSGGNRGQYIPDVLLSAAANFVRIHQPDFANHYRPFFLLVNLPAPCSATDGKDDFPVPTDAPFTGESWPQAAKNRAALITRLDAGIGRLLEQMDKSGMTNNVAVFLAGAVAPEKFASTNLNFLKLPGEVRGGTNEAHLRVPMIAHWPEHIPAKHVSPRPWSAADFAPTALEIGYIKRPASYAGISMMPTLLGEPGTNAPAAPDDPAPDDLKQPNGM
jgi:arylsulfatase A-like enzyme